MLLAEMSNDTGWKRIPASHRGDDRVQAMRAWYDKEANVSCVVQIMDWQEDTPEFRAQREKEAQVSLDFYLADREQLPAWVP